MSRERWNEHLREALAEVEEQRDDAVLYLSAIKVLLDLLARGHAVRQCGQEIAEALVQQLALETCAVGLCEPGGELTLVGFASQGQRLGGPRGGLGESGWLTLARLVRPGVSPTCFRRRPDGSFDAVAPGELAGEAFFVLPFAVGGEAGGALVLHSLVSPAQVFTRGRALALLGEIVGQVLTIARMRASVAALCADLEAELGVTRRALSDQQQSLRAYEENIHALTRALIRANRVKREFLGAVAHELRTPLNAILDDAALLRDGAAGTPSGEQATLLDRVLGNMRSLNGLIDDILFFVQLDAERVPLHREEVRTRALIEAVVAALPPAERARVPLRVAIAPEAGSLRVEETLVRRLLFHLLSNAFEFTSQGEVTVTVRPGEERGSAVLAVRDTGAGIAPERMSELREHLAPGDSSAPPRPTGLGLGLTLVQRCARLLGGEVTVESRPGAGSEFQVRIPDALVASSAEERPALAPRLMH
ncbi:MAG TPA: HAMP domain-containing sensor histidine kinase [Candidatus Limnocylindria bacterium]|nr:HAMP domain-containing sensor histidine kinase [Candidatus Limnocylindria bacterium]